MTDDQFSKLIGQMDRDGDGEVTYKEFLEYFTRDLDATTGTQRPPPLSLSFQASCSAFAMETIL
jgi:hypothetical protein